MGYVYAFVLLLSTLRAELVKERNVSKD